MNWSFLLFGIRMFYCVYCLVLEVDLNGCCFSNVRIDDDGVGEEV